MTEVTKKLPVISLTIDLSRMNGCSFFYTLNFNVYLLNKQMNDNKVV